MRSSDQQSSVDPAATKSPADCAAVRRAGHGRQHGDTGNTGRSQNQDNTRRAASAAGPGVIRVAHSPGINPTYPADAQLLFAAGCFEEGFHIVTGLLMAVVYVFFLEPRRGASPLLRGVLYGTAIWLLNVLIVLPAIGEGIAGQYHLSAAGIGGFAVAHMSYFLTLSFLTSSLRPINLETGGQLNWTETITLRTVLHLPSSL